MKKQFKVSALLLACMVLISLLFVQTVTIFAAAENITSTGTPIASVDRGNLSVTVDEDMPEPVYSGGDTAWSADTWQGGKDEALEDYFGIQFQENYVFTEFVFQEGCHYDDGGWFTTYRIEVLQGDTWVEATVTEDPEYPEDEDGTRVPFGDNFETYTFELEAIEGSAIRIIGLPGGSGNFVSCSEMEVYGSIPTQEPEEKPSTPEEPSNPEVDNPPAEDTDTPQTGDPVTMVALLSTVLAGAGIVTCSKKRK